MRATDGGYAQLLLKNIDEYDSGQRAFLSALVYGTLERMITLDGVLSCLIKGGIKKVDTEVAAVLRLGAYQLLYMDSVPDHAAVNESVKLCRKYGKNSAAGLVNAVLRKVKSTPIPSGDEYKYSLNREIVDALKHDYPEKWEYIAENSLLRPSPCIAVNVLKTNAETVINELEGEGVKAKLGVVKNTLICEKGNLTSTESFKKGHYHIIGTASAFAAYQVVAQNPKTVLDCCAAPGGKTAYVAEYCDSVTATELHESRVGLVNTLCESLGLSNVTAMSGDATKDLPTGEFDVVLCDVPCSGLGVIAKKPELRRKPLAINELVKTQRKILQNASKVVKTGGHIIYSTCALTRAENDDAVDWFLANHENFKSGNLSEFPTTVCETSDGKITFFPDGKTFDGFFVAIFNKMW